LYSRPHHQRIQRVLESLNTDLLLRNHCLFGGGTAIVLTHGEYRESVDVDLIVSSKGGYRELRSLVSAQGIQALMKRPLPLRREARIDQYGIRCAFDVDGAAIKFEIVFEGRVELQDPLPEDCVNGVWALTMRDKVATKLMANSDRWADDSVWSRDIIDLAVLTNGQAADPAGVAAAVGAYGSSVLVDFEKARTSLLAREGWLLTCMKRMQMTMPENDLRELIQGLAVAMPSAARLPRQR
jgi:Nucleotidyl transferase AbiEii toxin, Type IV TA system